jgi:hypothetical protein
MDFYFVLLRKVCTRSTCPWLLHYEALSSDHRYLAKSYILINHTSGNNSKHIHDDVKYNVHMDVFIGHRNAIVP